MRRLLLCPPLYPPNRGGSQRLFADLAHLWTEEGGRAVIYTGSVSPGREEVESPGERLTVRRFPVRVLAAGRWRGKLLGAAARLGPMAWQAALGFPHMDSPAYRRHLRTRAMAADGPFDLVVAGVLPHTHFMAPAATFSRRHGIPWVAVPLLHSGLLGRRPLRHVTGSAAGAVLSSASQVIALTEAEVPALHRLGVSPPRVHVLPAALMDAASAAATPTVAEQPKIPGAFYLQAGALSGDKGTLTLLAAHEGRVQRGMAGILVLAGTPQPEVEQFLARQGEAARRHTVLVQDPEDEMLQLLMGQARVVVQPGRADAFGLVILEAWRAGTPVLVSDAGGPPLLVRHGQDGLIFASGDAGALAAGLDRLLADPGAARALGARGRERLQAELTWRSVYPRWRQVFHMAMARPDAEVAP